MSDKEQYERLRDACLDGSATESEMTRLNELLSSSDVFLDDYLEHAQQDATLEWYGHSEHVVQNNAQQETRRVWQTKHLALAIAASFLLIMTTGWVYWSARSTIEIAKLEYASNCQWGMSSVPTSFDASLPAGRLRLISGIARLKFPKVTVTLEGPVDLEIVSSNRCRLHAGRVVGWVEPGGEGFVVETPCAEIIDRGTKFGIAVSESGEAQLDVIDGIVDVRHLATGRELTAKASGRVLVTKEALELVGSTTPIARPRGINTPTRKVVYIGTSDGVGDEAFITFGGKPEGSKFHRPDNTLLIKHAPSELYWERKMILRFDLSKLDSVEILSAHLRLDGVPTGMGYTSLVPDATFAVYGLLEEHEAHWDSSSVSWELFPGTEKGSPQRDDQKVMLIGHFLIPQSQPEGRFILDDPRLASFLRHDSDSIVTIMIERITPGTSDSSYVHGFASRTHPTASPPTLRIETNDATNGR